MGKHGHPDYGVSSASRNIFKTADVGEGAARLGSVVTFKRSGNVVFADGFENGLSPWIPQVGSTGSGVYIVTDPTFSGQFAAKVVTDAAGWYNANLVKRLWGLENTRVGVSFTFSTTPDITQVVLGVHRNTGSTITVCKASLDIAGGKLGYKTGALAYEYPYDLPDVFGDPDKFIDAKLICYPEGLSIAKLYLGSHEYKFGAPSCYTKSDTSQEREEVSITFYGSSGANAVGYVDRCVVTINE